MMTTLTSLLTILPLGVFTQVNPRDCPVSLDARLSPLQQAIRCAEEFIARQGYTDQPPVGDPELLVPEAIEFGPSLKEAVLRRRDTVERRAFAACQGLPAGAGFTVVFRYRDKAYVEAGRAVTMTANYGYLRVQHQAFRLAAIDELEGCKRFDQANPSY